MKIPTTNPNLVARVVPFRWFHMEHFDGPFSNSAMTLFEFCDESVAFLYVEINPKHRKDCEGKTDESNEVGAEPSSLLPQFNCKCTSRDTDREKCETHEQCTIREI